MSANDSAGASDPSSPRLVIVGAGAQAKLACETFWQRGIEVVGVLNPQSEARPDWPEAYGCSVFQGTSFESAIERGVTHSLICFADPSEKALWWDRAEAAGLEPFSAIHPAAVIASTARVGPGCAVHACAVVQPFAVLGRGVVINANATVEHDGVVEDFANLAPGVQLAGWVHVGERAKIFTGASVIPQIRIGKGAVVGAGAAVTKNVPPGSVAVGVPARIVRSVQAKVAT